MAKRPIKGNGNSKIRLIVLEAEGPEGELSQIASAIKDALRPSQVAQPRIAKPQAQVIEQQAVADDEFEAPEFEDADYLEEKSAQAAAPKPRKPAKRKVVDMELDKDVSLASFVEQHAANTDLEKYLVVVAYLCEHRKEIEAISADHVYTCFRKLGWPAGKSDFAQPLRNLKSKDLLEQGPSTGTYVVNHLGIDAVRKLAEG